MDPSAATDLRVSVVAPALLLGAGLGGFADGIVLHQILGWHHMLSADPEADLAVNLVADGVFHAGAWLAVLASVVWLWRRLRRSGPRPMASLLGPLVAGWGLFNIVEGLVNHHLLGLHHVRPGGSREAFDIGFLVLGALLILVGIALHRRGGRRADSSGGRRQGRHAGDRSDSGHT